MKVNSYQLIKLMENVHHGRRRINYQGTIFIDSPNTHLKAKRFYIASFNNYLYISTLVEEKFSKDPFLLCEIFANFVLGLLLKR